LHSNSGSCHGHKYTAEASQALRSQTDYPTSSCVARDTWLGVRHGQAKREFMRGLLKLADNGSEGGAVSGGARSSGLKNAEQMPSQPLASIRTWKMCKSHGSPQEA